MVTRAGVTEEAFHDIFATAEECYCAAYEQGLRRLSQTVAQAVSRKADWLERVRAGLVAMLGFFDDEPAWARVLVLEAPFGAALALECRQRLHHVLASLIEGGSGEDRVTTVAGADRPAVAGADRLAVAGADRSPLLSPALTGELVVGGVFSVIRTSMLESDEGGLVQLAPQLMSFIVGPYLGQAAAGAELVGTSHPVDDGVSPPVQLPVRPTRRTLLVLRAIEQAPRLNNREVAQAAGIGDEGQASKLLARLERRGVIENVGVGAVRGEPNAWLLTRYGENVLGRIENCQAPVPRMGSMPAFNTERKGVVDK